MPEIESVERISADAALPGGVECKTPRLDVVVLTDDGRLIDLEAQRRRVDAPSKLLFYAAKLLVENTPKGREGDYGSAPQVVAVMLLEGSVLFPEEGRFLTACHMGWDFGDGRLSAGPDRIVLVLAELDKVRERYNGGGGMDEVLADESLAWLYMLAGGYEDPEEMGMMAESFPTMEEFAARYGVAVGDPDLKRKYDAWWQAEMEYNSAISYARREGVGLSIKRLREAGMADAADFLERASS
ncbi:MAG: PD-(D/E)XK nuclease family transposase [Eggerthellaceae bacterium]|nr:PD-(D/E)XK nuclease family transposase [Eggerthellaceae bacterium]